MLEMLDDPDVRDVLSGLFEANEAGPRSETVRLPVSPVGINPETFAYVERVRRVMFGEPPAGDTRSDGE